MSNFAEDYIPVAERIGAFYAKHPDGSLQSELVELNETRVTIRAFAYRSPDDPRPGIGISSLEIPGKTPYTRGSEIENCETSAWGRAIAALGFEVKRGVASAEEVRAKEEHSDNGSGRATHPPARPSAAPRLAVAVSVDEDPTLDAPPDWDLPGGPTGQPSEPGGTCPDHGTPWTWKDAGSNDRTGKSWDGFWKCDGKTDGEWCKKRPPKAWAARHEA